MDAKAFLDAVKAAYKAKGLKQKDLADLVGITPTSINAILCERTPLSPDMAKKLADVSGADLRIFWGADAVGPAGEFVSIPLREASASMGPGSFENSRKIRNFIAFREDWIHSKGTPSRMSAIRASGTSMTPTIPDGCIVLIDESQVEPQNGRIYYIRKNDGYHLKRMRKIKDAWYIESDEDGTRVPIKEYDEFEIFGRAIWYGCEL